MPTLYVRKCSRCRSRLRPDRLAQKESFLGNGSSLQWLDFQPRNVVTMFVFAAPQEQVNDIHRCRRKSARLNLWRTESDLDGL